MKELAELVGQELVWSQPKATKRDYELRAGDDVIATLRFQRGSLADAASGASHWTFKRAGFWQPRVTVRLAGAVEDMAVFRPRWTGGGHLEFPDGRSLQLNSANFWQSRWVWQDKDNELINIKAHHGLLKAGGTVEILPASASDPNLALLVLLGWYLILLYAEDSSAASTSAILPAITT